MPRARTHPQHRIIRGLVPGVVGVGAAVLLSLSASHRALGVLPEPANTAATCSAQTAPADCLELLP